MEDLRLALARIPNLTLPAELWTFLEEAWELNPEEVTRMIERALNAQKPSGYFIRSVRNAMEVGLGAPGGAARTEREKRTRRLANLAANARRSGEFTNDDAGWERYVREEAEDVGVAGDELDAIIASARAGRAHVGLTEPTPGHEVVGDDGLTAWARQHRERLIRGGIDPEKFTNGATPAERELYQRVTGRKEPVA